MADAGQNVLQTLLDRLLAGLLNGPGLNCRPHASRQRIDLTALAKLRDIDPSNVLTTLLSPERKVKVIARVAAPARTPDAVRDRFESAPAAAKNETDPAQ